MHRDFKFYLQFFIFIAISVAPALSQQDAGTRTPSWLRLSLEQRTRYEQLSHPFRPNTSNTERHFPLRTRLRLEIGETYRPIRFLVEFQDSRVLHDKEQLYSTRSNINEHDILQAYLELSPSGFPSKNSKSRIILGRFTMDLGKRRLVARNKMRNTTNAFDGVLWTLAGNWDWTIRSFFTRPAAIDPYSMDVSSRRYFWGAYFASTRYPRFLADLYYFGLHDMGDTGSGQKLSTVGARIYRLPTPKSVDYEVESAWQFGRNGLLDHSAYFYHGELGLSLDAGWSPRISLRYDYASGDRDPEDGRSGRFDSLYGARSFEYALTGIYGPFYRSNIDTPGIGIEFRPADTLKISSSYRTVKLAQARDAWVGSGLQDPTARSGKSIGQNIETRIRWAASRYLTVECGYAHFFKGSYLNLVPGSSSTGNSNYVYVSAETKAKLLPY